MKTTRRTFALLLAIILCLSLLPAAVASDEPIAGTDAALADIDTEPTPENEAPPAEPDATPADEAEPPVPEEIEIPPETIERAAPEEPGPALDGANRVKVSAENFPDEVFYAVVSQIIDTNGNGWLSDAEIAAVEVINLSYDRESFPYRISSLQGIEYFTSLQYLIVEDQYLQELDVGKNTKLVELDVNSCLLRTLDLRSNTALQYLFCSRNSWLTSVDLSRNTQLLCLECRNDAGLQNLDLHSNTELRFLDCGFDSRTTRHALDISCNTKLLELYCENRSMEELDISTCPELYALSCYGNAFTELDISANDALIDVILSAELRAQTSNWQYTAYGFMQTPEGGDTEEFVSYVEVAPDLIFLMPGITITGSFGEEVDFVLQDWVLTISGTGAMDDGDEVNFLRNMPVRSVVIEEGVTSIGSNAFCRCGQIQDVSLPDGLTSIGAGAFYQCKGLMTVDIPDTVTEIGDRAFSLCARLTHVTLGSGVRRIGAEAFFESAVTDIELPDGLDELGEQAFRDCYYLQKIVLPVGLEAIPDGAFAICGMLTSVTIPLSVKQIGNYAFDLCPLEDVYYGGSAAQWYQMEIGYANDSLEDAVRHFGGSDPAPVPGDANGSGSTDVRDAALILAHIADHGGESALDLAAADMNGDGRVDALDAALILQYAVGNRQTLPTE